MALSDTDSTAMPVTTDLAESGNIAALIGPVTLRIVSRLLLGEYPQNIKQYNALAYRLGMCTRGKPYSAYYIKYIMQGKMPYTAEIEKAASKLLSELKLEPPDKSRYKSVIVLVPNGVEVPEGTIVLRGAEVCICGASFIPTIWNQINHTTACAKMRTMLRRLK